MPLNIEVLFQSLPITLDQGTTSGNFIMQLRTAIMRLDTISPHHHCHDIVCFIKVILYKLNSIYLELIIELFSALFTTLQP